VNTGYATIIMPIGGQGHGEVLKLFLHTEVEPRFDLDEPRRYRNAGRGLPSIGSPPYARP